MSEIHVKCTDQVLKITEAPIIASGGVNETKVVFTFCEKWDGFVKTALFYVDADKKYSVVLDENDICILPWEVCAENGSFYFSVFGDKGDTRRTSSIVKYKVSRGVIVDETFPSDPTLEVYDQIAAMLAENRQFTEDFIASSGASIEAAKIAQAAAEEAMGVVGNAVLRVKENNTGDFFGFWIGTQEQYDAIEQKEQNRLYLISNDEATGETEWVNPPMLDGIEYRLTKRLNGKPVYAMSVNFGALPNNGDTTIGLSTAGSTIEEFVALDVFAQNEQGRKYKLPFFNSMGELRSIYRSMGERSIWLKTLSDLSSYAGRIYAEYTKA